MPLFSAFCAGSDTERSLSIDAAKTLNLFRATVESPGAAKAATLYGTPGTRTLGTLPTYPNRGAFTQDGRTFTVSGGTLYELTFNPFLGTVRGLIADDGAPVSLTSNGDGGSQLAIVGGGQLSILDLVTNVLAGPVALPLTNAPLMIGYLDGYFILMEQDSLRGWFSAIENGLSWDALDFFTRSTASDHVVAQICANNRIWIFGSETTEAYEDTGDADNPFQPIKGSLFQIGCAAAWSVSVGVQTIRWLGRSSRGGAVVYRLDGYNGTRISTHAIEQQLGKASTLANAEGLTYEQDGHLFYALSCPSLNDGETHVVDEGEQAWHGRSDWNPVLGRDEIWRVRGHAYVGNVHVVGSRDSGAIWALDLECFTADERPIRAVRRCPYLGAENSWMTLDRVELGMEPGVGLTSGQGSDPQVELRLSKDAGKTWFSAGTSPIGPLGDYDYGAYWTQLGQVRVDRLVLEIVITDAVKRAWGPGLWVTVTPGRSTGQAAA